MWISRRVYDALEEQAEFWRKRYEEERTKSERLFDQLLMVHGEAPVTDVVRAEQKSKSDVVEKLVEETAKQLREIYGEEGEDETADELVAAVETQLATMV